MAVPRRPKERQVFSLGQFGVNRVLSPIHMPDGSLESAQNAQFDKIELVGGIRKRAGMIRLGAPTQAAAALVAFQRVLLTDTLPKGDPDGQGPAPEPPVPPGEDPLVAAPVIVYNPTYCADTVLTQLGWGHLPNPPAPATALVLSAGASGGDFGTDAHGRLTYYIQVAAITGANAYSDPLPFCPAASSITLAAATKTIQVAWTASPDAVKYRVYLGWHYYTLVWCQYIETVLTSCTFTKNPRWVAGLKTGGGAGDILLSEITPGAALATYSEGREYSVAGLTSLLVRGPMALPHGNGHARGYRKPIRVDWTAVVGALGGYRVFRGSPGTAFTHYKDVAAGVLFLEDDMLGTGWIAL